MSAVDQRPVLITGGAGFIGSNLADRLAAHGHDVVVYDALSRDGVERNLNWLQQRHPGRIGVMIDDVRDAARLADAVGEAKAVFHMAAQVAVTTSLLDPTEDFGINIQGSFHLLEALRTRAPETPLIFASTNKVYGDLSRIELVLGEQGYGPIDDRIARNGVSEAEPLDFHTPYGCSKGAADQYVLDYARSFGLRAAVMRMSCIYGQRQMGTEDQGWVAHFLIRALQGQPITIYGDGHQVRDILHVDDAVTAYLGAWHKIDDVRGRAFNLGGGVENAVSLRTLIDHIGTLLGRAVDLRFEPWRAGDQRYFVADTQSIDHALGLDAKLCWREGVTRLARWLASERGLPSPRTAPAPALVTAS
ncbi:MAG: NAD-dependent epimerase/dehydratase family protein [Pseudomonadota bacterium]